MYRMKNGFVMLELNAESRSKGYTMRSNINPDFIHALKRSNQDDAAAIRNAIKRQDCKAVIRHLEYAKSRNREIRELSKHHDKLIYDASGKAIHWWDHEEKRLYIIE